MRFLKALLAFFGALIAGWLIIVFGFVLLTDVLGVLKVSSLEGANAMGVIFMIGPAGGIVLGLIAAIWVFMRSGKAQKQ